MPNDNKTTRPNRARSNRIPAAMDDALRQFATRLPAGHTRQGERVNHLRRLRTAFRVGGQDAVVEYLRPFESYLHQPTV